MPGMPAGNGEQEVTQRTTLRQAQGKEKDELATRNHLAPSNQHPATFFLHSVTPCF